jgi:hypothetical protein
MGQRTCSDDTYTTSQQTREHAASVGGWISWSRAATISFATQARGVGQDADQGTGVSTAVASEACQ